MGIEKFSAPGQKNSFENLSGNTDSNYEMDEYSDYCYNPEPESRILAKTTEPLSSADDAGFTTVRSSSRSNKASIESMKDTTKIFGGSGPISKPTAAINAAESSGHIPEEAPNHDVSMDGPDTDHPDTIPLESQGIPPLSAFADTALGILASLRNNDPCVTGVYDLKNSK